MLGIALFRQDKVLFDRIVKILGEQIKPFSNDFDQGRGNFNKRVQALLNLTLKASIVTNEL